MPDVANNRVALPSAALGWELLLHLLLDVAPGIVGRGVNQVHGHRDTVS